MSDREKLVRWRLVLGGDAEQGLGCGLDGTEARQDRALGYLYNREYRAGRNVRPTQRVGPGSLDPSKQSKDEMGSRSLSHLWMKAAPALT